MSGIKMDAYANEHGPERKMVFSAYSQMLEAVVVQHAAVDTLAGSAFAVDLFVPPGIPGYAGLKAQAAMVLYVNGAAITAFGTFASVGTCSNASAFPWTAVFMCVLGGIISPRTHFVSGSADGMAFPAEGDVTRGVFGRFCPAVDVNERIDVPAFQQFISRDVVMGGVKADIFWGKAKNIAPEIVHGEEEVFAVMAACAGEIYQ
jgi:hypothetical protein